MRYLGPSKIEYIGCSEYECKDEKQSQQHAKTKIPLTAQKET